MRKEDVVQAESATVTKKHSSVRVSWKGGPSWGARKVLLLDLGVC